MTTVVRINNSLHIIDSYSFSEIEGGRLVDIILNSLFRGSFSRCVAQQESLVKKVPEYPLSLL